MKINKSSRFEPLIFLLIAALFFGAGVNFEIRLFAVWGIVSVVFAAAIFLIHKFSKRRTENVYVPLFFLFVGCLVICAGLFELRDKLLILAGGVFMAFGVLMGFLFSSEGQRIKDEKLRNSIRMPSEFIVLFAVKETEENNDVKWYVIDKRTGRTYVFAENKYALTDFGTVRMLACSKYARCFMVDEMKKRSFWADFSEDNWWKKLKIKFDKTQCIDILQNKDESNSDGTTRDYRKIGLLSCERSECEVRTADVRSDRRESGIDERKVASKLAIKLSKEYYYIGNANSFWLFLSRNRETLLGIYALSYQKEYIEFETKKVAVSEYTIDSSECVGKVIADCFGRSMKELDCEQLFRILYSVMGYEYISSRRLETLFSLKDKEISWEYYENISYDRATGQPYFVRERVTQSGHGWISDYSVKRISYDEVAKKALVYAPASKFINISDTNWREILDFTPDGDDLSTTYTYTTGKLNETSMFEVFVSFDEHNEYLYKKRLQRDLCPEQIHGLTETYKDSDISGLMKYDAECMQRIDKIAHSDQKNMTFPNMNYSVNKLAGRKLLEAIRKGEFEKFLMAAPGYRFDTDRNFPEMNNYSEQFHALNEYGKSNREFENELIQALRNCLKERGRFGYAYHIVRIICEQVLYERNGKNSMDFITDDLLKELREMILLNKEKLMDYKEWDGKLYEDGMYGALKYHCDFISTVSGDKYKIL